MSKDNISRRKVLRGAVGSGIIGLGTSLNVSIAAANDTNSTPVTILEGNRKLELAQELSKTSEFTTLLETANEMGYTLDWSSTNLQAARTDSKQVQRDVAEYTLSGTGDDVDALIIIARDNETNEVEAATFDLEYFNADGLWQRTKQYALIDGTIETRTIKPDKEALDGLVSELEPTQSASVAQNGLSTQGIIPDLPDVLKINDCTGCYESSKLICTAVCNAGGTFSCLVLGITVVGAVTCTTFVKAVCFVAKKASGCGNRLAATICKPSGIGACGPNEKVGGVIRVDIPYI